MAERAFVVSDTHLGAGVGDPLEDFDQDASFAGFVRGIAAAETTLFVNGDFIDFAQIPPFDVPKPVHLLWTEKASLEKLEAAITGHGDCFAALRDLVAREGKLVVLIGNHDLDFAWPAVQARFRRELRCSTDAVRFAVGVETFRGVHIEHGHEFTDENCPLDPRAFIHEHRGERYLERVWGTDFMLQFYNDLERSHPYADNVKPMRSILWHGLKNRWIGGRELIRFLAFLKGRGVPWGLVSAVLAGDDAMTDEQAAQLAVASFAESEWQEVLLERVQDPAFREEVREAARELDRAERDRIVRSDAVEVGAPDLVKPEKATVLGLVRDDRERRAARDRLGRDGVTAVVFGHTHGLVDGEQLEGRMKRRLYNPGTWLPKLDLKSEHVRQKIKRLGLTKDMLRDHGMYATERTAVRIDENAGHEARVAIVAVP
jgi:UDP-2,3-diacylglucosamine pyrophosphatase LpxH